MTIAVHKLDIQAESKQLSTIKVFDHLLLEWTGISQAKCLCTFDRIFHFPGMACRVSIESSGWTNENKTNGPLS